MQTVIGIFDNAEHARMAAKQLAAAGFSLDDVDTISRDSNKSDSNYYNRTGTATESAADAAGRTGDGIGNFFSNLFGTDDDDANRYSHVARNSNSMVTVHCKTADHAKKAADILDNAGAIDVNERAKETGYASNMNAKTGAKGNTDQNQVSAKVIEENLQVGKRVEQTGGARLRSRIVERPVEASVRLREEHVNVERTPVNRPATEADFNAFKEGEVEVTERAERAVVGKEARVVEEVTLGKNVTEREKTIHDTVRKTEVDVEQLGTKDVRNDQNKPSK